MDPGSGDSTWLDPQRLEAVRRESRALRQMAEEARSRAQVVRARVGRGRPQREILRDSAFARLQAKLGTLPVIEQAKGIIMARQNCGPYEAFDLLRRASQRTNVKVHVLAAQIVAQVASCNNSSNVTPISRRGYATSYPRSHIADTASRRA